MATPVHVQNSGSSASGSGTPVTAQVTLAGVSAGNALVAVCMIENSSRSITISDDKGNTWEDAIPEIGNGAASRRMQISVAFNVAAGDTIISGAAAGSGSVDVILHVFEVQDIDAIDVTDTFDNTASDTDKECADVGEIDTAAEVFVVACGKASGSFGTITYPSGFTGTTEAAAQAMVTYRVSATALTDERAAWTHTTARGAFCGIASFKFVSSEVDDPSTDGLIIIRGTGA